MCYSLYLLKRERSSCNVLHEGTPLLSVIIIIMGNESDHSPSYSAEVKNA